MKKMALFLALCMMGTAVFCGCGSKDNEEISANESSVSQSAELSDAAQDDSAEVSVTGTWGVSEIIDADGNSQTFEEYCEAQGVDPELTGCTYVFNDDGSLTATVAGVEVEGSYEFDGSTLTYTVNDASTSCTYNAEKETLECADENTGVTSIMTRQ